MKKKLKNNLIFLSLLVLIFGLVYLVLAFLPNQLSWKIFNWKKDFDQASYFYPKWDLALTSNKLDKLYKEKKYKDLEEKLKKIKESDCSLKKDEISNFCENIFYLDGLVKYRLGEKEEKGKRDNFWKEAVSDFYYTLAINPKNLWAKENINFILNRKKNLENKSSANSDKKEGEKGNEKNNEKNDKKNTEKNDGKNDEKNQKSSQKNNDAKSSGEKNKNENNGNTSDKNKSRLPDSINQALKDRLEELENNEAKSNGFSRSAKQAQMKNQDNPFSVFENDPFFKAFFGDDPFFNHRRPNLSRQINNPDEKDW